MQTKWLTIIVYVFIALSVLSIAGDFLGLIMMNSLQGAFASMFMQRFTYVLILCIAAWQLLKLRPWSLHVFSAVFIFGLIGDHLLGLFLGMGFVEYILVPAIILSFGFKHRELLAAKQAGSQDVGS